MGDVQPFEHVPGEPLLYRPARALTGWLNENEAIQALLGRNPVPTDDLTEMKALIAKCRHAVESRPTYSAVNPIVKDQPSEFSDLATHPEFGAAFAGLNWRFAVVDLRAVLSFQKLIQTDGLEGRIGGAVRDEALLRELCIPQSQPAHPIGAFTDIDGKGFTISSFNPNLRIAGGQLGEAQVSPAPGLPTVKMQAVTLLVFMGTSYLQMARYKDRTFVRDGYHRAAGLIRHGVYEVPCVFIEAASFDQVGPTINTFSYEVLFGDRPPRLVDFWDDSVASNTRQVAVRKVIRVRGEEFVVPR